GIELGTQIPTQYFPLAVPIASGSMLFTVIAFIAGLSAASGAIIAISLAIATMILNHWILPATPLGTKQEIYGQLVCMRRMLIAELLVAGYTFYVLLDTSFSLTEVALTAFIVTLQFLPGVIAVLHWSRGNRKGLYVGLLAGIFVWAAGIFVPMLSGL